MAHFGSWTTPITSELVVRAAAGLGGVSVRGHTVIWAEQRPEEGGRTQLVRLTDDGPAVDLLPATIELGVGAVTKVIRDAIEPGDLIVMTSHGAGGLRRWLLGSVADKLLRSGVAPVMLVPVELPVHPVCIWTSHCRDHSEARSSRRCSIP